MKMTYQPKKRQRSKVHGFRKRMSTAGGRKVLAARRLKGRKNYQHRPRFVVFLLILIILRGYVTMQFSESLKKNRDFQKVYRLGKSYANKYLVMYILENHTERNRIGISVSKKVGNSVIRHHLTRLIRESYRLQEDMFHSGWDIVIIARASAKEVGFHQIESALMHLGGLHKITKKKMESF